MIKMTGIGENERVIEIPWDSVTLEEAIYLMANHDRESFIDGDKKCIIIKE